MVHVCHQFGYYLFLVRQTALECTNGEIMKSLIILVKNALSCFLAINDRPQSEVQVELIRQSQRLPENADIRKQNDVERVDRLDLLLSLWIPDVLHDVGDKVFHKLIFRAFIREESHPDVGVFAQTPQRHVADIFEFLIILLL